MPGLYTLVTRAPGTLITALIYNGDHQADADGRSAQFMQAFATNLTQANISQSPYGSDGVTENLPISVANELAVLRFVISQVKEALNGGSAINWWEPITAPALPAIGARVIRSSSLAVPNNTLTTLDFTGGSAGSPPFNSGVWEGVTHPTRFTAPTSGLYYAFCSVLWDQHHVDFPISQADGIRQLAITVNGGAAGSNAEKTNTTAPNIQQRQTLGGLMKLAANDYVEFKALQTCGSSINLLGDANDSIVGGIIFFGVTS